MPWLFCCTGFDGYDMSVTEHDNSTDELKAMLGDGGFSAIANTLASFRQK